MRKAADAVEQSDSVRPADARFSIDSVTPVGLAEELRALKAGDFVVQELIVHGISSFAAHLQDEPRAPDLP